MVYFVNFYHDNNKKNKYYKKLIQIKKEIYIYICKKFNIKIIINMNWSCNKKIIYTKKVEMALAIFDEIYRKNEKDVFIK